MKFRCPACHELQYEEVDAIDVEQLLDCPECRCPLLVSPPTASHWELYIDSFILYPGLLAIFPFMSFFSALSPTIFTLIFLLFTFYFLLLLLTLLRPQVQHAVLSGS